jgi:hypothetical protein
MTFHEMVSLVNFILPTIAFLGYAMRIGIGIKNKDTRPYRVMLPLFLIASLGASIIYFLNFTGWWRLIEPNFETYSRLYIRFYFTYLGSLFVLSAWIHPELHPIIVKIKEIPWTIFNGLISKKK